MIHFAIHVNNDYELNRLPSIRVELGDYFPAARLHVFNQTLKPVEGSIVCENTKDCGFGWTVRFLRHIYTYMEAGDLLIKIDPDTEIYGNPIAGLQIPPGSVFGEFMVDGGIPLVFYGGFQGYTREAVRLMLEHGHKFENERGPQDIAAQKIIDLCQIPCIIVPYVDLWSREEAADETLIWHRERGFRQGCCK